MREAYVDINDKKFRIANIKDMYYLINNRGMTVLSIYYLQFIIQLGENRFAVGAGTNYYNKKSFAIFNYDPTTCKIEKEFGCEYYGKDSDSYQDILRNVHNIYRNKVFLLQGNKRLYIYDTKSKKKIILKNIPFKITTETYEDKIVVRTKAKSQYDEKVTDEVEFTIYSDEVPIRGFYSSLQDTYHELISREETAAKLHKKIEEVTYEDVVNTTFTQNILYYLNNTSYGMK